MEKTLKEVLKAVTDLRNKPNVRHPTYKQLRQESEKYGVRTKWGNIVFHTMVKHRIAPLTVHMGSLDVRQRNPTAKQKELLKKLPQTLKLVHAYMKRVPFVCVERTMGESEFTPHCTFFISTQLKEMVRIAYAWATLLAPPKKKPRGPKFYFVMIPEWQSKDMQTLVFPEVGVTYALGTNYIGECKKAFLRMAMWHAKKRGMLGLHAGSKIIRARDAKTGKIKEYGALIFGLTATGKTTHTCHDHDLKGPGEGVKIVQDDVVLMKSDCSALGPEKAYYLKTEGLNPKTQPLLYQATTKRNTILENVMVDYLGTVDFDDQTLTGNGRGVIPRENFHKQYISEGLDLPPVKRLDGLLIFIITRRNTVVPIVSKLTPEQAAAAFMLGESVESTGGDPKRVGESVRVVGTNPFTIGDEYEEGNRFYKFIKKYPTKVRCYLLNTGGVGEIIEKAADGTKVVKQKVLRVEIPEMASIIRGIARGTIEWEKEPHFGTLVPKKVEGIDIKKFDLSKFYSKGQIRAYVSKLKQERVEWLSQFKGLNSAIGNAFK